MAFLVIIVASVGFFGVSEIFEEFDFVADETAPELAVLGQIESLSYRMLLEAVSFAILHSEDDSHNAQEELEEFEETNKKLDLAIIKLQKLETEDDDDDDEEEMFITKVVILKGKLHDTSLSLINTIENNGDRQTIFVLKSELEELEEEFSSEIEARIQQEEEELLRRDNVADQLASDVETVVTAVGILGIILSIIFATIISGKLSKRIVHLRDITTKIASGNLNTRATVEGNDEISELSSEVNIMAKNLLEKNEELVKSQKIAVLGSIASRLSHDLRNPLTVIKGNLDLMTKHLGSNMDENTKKFNKRIDDSVDAMNNIIDDVLQFSKTPELQKETSSINELLESSLSRIEVPDRIKITLPEDDFLINCDQSKIKSVFSNLITNSIQSIEKEGKITVSIKEESNYMNIAIEDSGSGIAEDDISKIFEPMFTTKVTGTGLGLGICKNIIDEHGGKISMHNNPTTFTIKLPKKNIIFKS